MKTTEKTEAIKRELFTKIMNRGFCKEIPSREEKVKDFIHELFRLLFPTGEKNLPKDLQLEQSFLLVKRLFHELQWPVGNKECCYDFELENNFLKELPAIFDSLFQDAEAIFTGDPAANSIEEVIHTYPGFYAIFVYRVAHQVYLLNKPLLARMLSEYAHSLTGIDIHPGADIGHHFGIDHGTGIVIGETANIGNYVKIYQGVTLGAKSVNKDLAARKRHPTINDHVVIYANATILGGDTVIGNNTIIGGNVFITKSIPENSVVYQKNDVIVKKQDLDEEIHEFIIKQIGNERNIICLKQVA